MFQQRWLLFVGQTENVAHQVNHYGTRHTAHPPKSPCIRGVTASTPRMHGDLGGCCFFRLAFVVVSLLFSTGCAQLSKQPEPTVIIIVPTQTTAPTATIEATATVELATQEASADSSPDSSATPVPERDTPFQGSNPRS